MKDFYLNSAVFWITRILGLIGFAFAGLFSLYYIFVVTNYFLTGNVFGGHLFAKGNIVFSIIGAACFSLIFCLCIKSIILFLFDNKMRFAFENSKIFAFIVATSPIMAFIAGLIICLNGFSGIELLIIIFALAFTIYPRAFAERNSIECGVKFSSI